MTSTSSALEAPPPVRPLGAPAARITAARTAPGRFRLGRAARRVTLIVHIVAAGAWIGIDVVLGVLATTALATGNTDTEALAFRALGTFVVWPLLAAGLLTLASGVILGLGTNYGLVRYWWVAIKLAANVVLVALVIVALRPGLDEARTHGEALAAGNPSEIATSNLLFPPVVSLTVLIAATTLSIFKPWGRIRATRGSQKAKP